MPQRMKSVLVIGTIRYDERNHLYSAIVYEVLYSLKIRPNTIIYVDEDFAELEQGHYYLVFGEVSRGRSPLYRLHKAEYETPATAAAGVAVPSAMDITGDRTKGEYYKIPPDNLYEHVADTLQVINNSILVNQTGALETLQPFHQEELYFVEGRSFTADEYAAGSHAAVISALLAARLEIGIGDTIDLSIAVSEYAGIYKSYWAGSGFSYSAPFEVVGIINTLPDKSWYVFVPRSNEIPSSAFPVGYTVGQALIRNEDAALFYTRTLPKLDERFLLTIYDQGYSAVAVPFQTILSVAKIVTAVCALVELAVLILFGFLYIYRQREASETMQMLGTGRLRVLGYFLISSGFISLLAAIAGAYTAYRLHDRIIALVAKSAENAALIDSRFSNGNLSSLRTLEFAPHLDVEFFLSLALIVILLALLTCLGFTIGTFLNSKPGRRKLPGPQKEHKTSHLSGGSIKYATLSILRGGTRSTVVPLLAIAAVIFFGQLARTSQHYQDQLDLVYDNTTITGYYTDINGKQIRNLILNGFDIFNLYRSGQVTDLSVSIGEPYYYIGVRAFANGTMQLLEPLFVPRNSFARDSLEASILRGPDLTATNDIHTSPEFYYSDTLRMSFLDGYDESFLAVPFGDPDVFNCMIPTSLMQDKGITFGDTIRVAINQIYHRPGNL